jgi:hypothetical protein
MTLVRRHEHPRLALLIGAHHKGDIGIHNDLMAMYVTLQTRGLALEEILSLEGNLDRQILITFLKEVSHGIAKWSQGELFLYLSGHGFFTGDSVEEARVGIELQNDLLESRMQDVYWEEVFSALSIPEAVTFTMLIDH